MTGTVTQAFGDDADLAGGVDATGARSITRFLARIVPVSRLCHAVPFWVAVVGLGGDHVYD